MAGERNNGSKPEGITDVRDNIDNFAMLMKDIAATGEEGQQFANDQIVHISSAVQNSLSPQVREAVGQVRRQREMMNA